MVSNEQIKSRNRASLLTVGGLFAALFVMINAQQFLIAALIYIVIAVVGLVLYNQWSNIGRAGKLVGIDNNFITDALVGFGLGIGTILLGSISPVIGAIGIPNVQSLAGTIGRAIVIVVLAPIFEEVLFRDFILDFFDEKFTDMPFVVANLITAVLFSLFHLVAYGDSLSAVSGSFFTAGLMAVVFGYVRLFQNSIIGAIVYHGVLNLWIGFLKLSVVVG